MRYLVIDDHGNRRESFDSQVDVLAELAEIVRDDRAALETLYVVQLDDDGQEVGSAQRADEVLAVVDSPGPFCGFVFDFLSASVAPLAAANGLEEIVGAPRRPDGLLAATR
jgi:hypothetical protein